MNKGLFSSTFIYMVSYSLTRFVGFLLLPLYSNILTPAEFGSYSLLMAVYAILNVLYQAGLLQGFTGYFFNEKYPRRGVVSTTLLLLAGICLILSIILTLASKPLTLIIFSDSTVIRLFVLLVWILFIDNLSFLGLHLLKTERKAASVAVFSAITALVNITLNLIFLLYLKLGIAGIIMAQGASGLVLLALCTPSLLKYILPLFRSKEPLFNKALAASILRFSLPFVFAGIFGILMDVADRFLIDTFLDRESVGIYSLAYRIAGIMGIFIIAFRTAYLPHILSKKESSDLPDILRDTFTRLLALMSILYLFVVFFLHDIALIRIGNNFLINPAYAEALYLIPIILLAYMFNGLASFFALSPYITGKTHLFIISDALGLTVNIILNLILIPRWQIAGAAAATFLGFFTATVYLYLVFILSIKIQFSFLKLLIIVSGSFAAATAAYYTSSIPLKIMVLLSFSILCWILVKPVPKNLSVQSE